MHHFVLWHCGAACIWSTGLNNGSPCWSYIKMHILFLLLIINPGQQMEQAGEQKQ